MWISKKMRIGNTTVISQYRMQERSSENTHSKKGCPIVFYKSLTKGTLRHGIDGSKSIYKGVPFVKRLEVKPQGDKALRVIDIFIVSVMVED